MVWVSIPCRYLRSSGKVNKAQEGSKRTVGSDSPFHRAAKKENPDGIGTVSWGLSLLLGGFSSLVK